MAEQVMSIKSTVLDRRKQKVRERHHPDYVLALVVFLLLVIGLLAVFSATFDWGYQKTGNGFHFALIELLWVVLGVAVAVVVMRVPYNWWQRVALPVMGLTVLMLLLVLPFGSERFGAQRSFFNGSVQPGEMAKLGVVIYIATWLASKGEQVRDLTYGLIPFAVLIGGVAGLIVAQPDISAAVMVVLTALAMFFFAGADLVQLGIGGAVSSVTFVLLVNRFEYARARIDAYFQVWRDPDHISHHLQQAFIALGSGGPIGVGPGQGHQKFGYLPAPHTDSIFAVIGEEAGLFGCLLVLVLFGILAYRGYRIAQQSPDAFGSLLACGVTTWLVVQALINVGVITAIVPFTGISLPFISYGGSAMVVSMFGVGLLLSISRGQPMGSRSDSAHLGGRGRHRGTHLPGTGRRTSA